MLQSAKQLESQMLQSAKQLELEFSTRNQYWFTGIQVVFSQASFKYLVRVPGYTGIPPAIYWSTWTRGESFSTSFIFILVFSQASV